MKNEPNNGSEASLTGRQEKLIQELITNPIVAEAARAAGVGRTTAHRWLNEPLFCEELARRRHKTLAEAMNSVQSHTARAVEELIGLMNSPNEWLKRLVCLDVLNNALRIRETEEVEKRLCALEEAFEKQAPTLRRKS